MDEAWQRLVLDRCQLETRRIEERFARSGSHAVKKAKLQAAAIRYSALRGDPDSPKLDLKDARGAVTWRCLILCGLKVNTELFLDEVDAAFEGALANDEELKSQMVQSLSKERETIGLQAIPHYLGRWKRTTKRPTNNVRSQKTSSPAMPTAEAWQGVWYPCAFPPSPFFGWFGNEPSFPSFGILPSRTVPRSAHIGGGIGSPFSDVVVGQNSRLDGNPVPTVATRDWRVPKDSEDMASIPDTEWRWKEWVEKKPKSVKGSYVGGLESIADDEQFSEPEAECDNSLTSKCEECGCEGRHWNKHGHYWCNGCWVAWYNEKEASKIGNDEERPPDAFQRYERMPDPIYLEESFQTKVQVENVNCLIAASIKIDANNQNRVCILVIQSTIKIDDNRVVERWPLSELWESTSFRKAFDGADMEDRIVPVEGGFHLPEVIVPQDELGGGIDFRVPVIFGAAPEEQQDGAFRSEMEKKLRNLLRICYQLGHREIVLSSRFERLPAREVTSLLRWMLIEDQEFKGAFRRIVFAMPHAEVSANVFLGLRAEFKLNGLLRDAWKDGRVLMPKDGNSCLRANFNGFEQNGRGTVNGMKLEMCAPRLDVGCEDQHWMKLDCGRIALSAFPSFCLNSSDRSHRRIHVWDTAVTNDSLQLWIMGDDGSICLKSDPDVYLNCLEEPDGTTVARLERSPKRITFWTLEEPQIAKLRADEVTKARSQREEAVKD